MGERKIHADQIVADILDGWPQTVPMFLQYRMNCPGCFMNSFETLEEALNIYDLPVNLFVRELNEIVDESE